MTLTVALLAGFVVTIIDKRDFPDYGTAVWWAVVTLGTVGYGDVVPHTGWGRVVGSVVIIVGVTFIAFLTAVITSLFVEEEQKTHRMLIEDAQRASQDETHRLLEDVSMFDSRQSRRCCATCRAVVADLQRADTPKRAPAPSTPRGEGSPEQARPREAARGRGRLSFSEALGLLAASSSWPSRREAVLLGSGSAPASDGRGRT